MAKKSIGDIVLRAVVDTSGVAQGLNNIGAQVAGRQFGTGQGGPQGASGAAGGFVNPHGGGAGPGAAAVAAAAAAGAAAARGGRAHAMRSGAAWSDYMREQVRRDLGGDMPSWRMASIGMPGAPTLGFYDWAMRRRMAAGGRFYAATSSWNAAVAAPRGEIGAAYRSKERWKTILGAYERAPGWAQAAVNIPWMARNAAQRAGQGIRNAVGGAIDRVAMSGFDPIASATRFAGLLGMGRFSALGGMGVIAGAPIAGAAMGYNMYQNRYNSVMDISRFNFGADRQAAMRMRQAYKQPGQKAPLDLMDRFWLGAYKASPNDIPWMERAVKGFGTVGDWAENTGARMASPSVLDYVSMVSPITAGVKAIDQTVNAFRRMFN